ncbi:hypothetical protein VaNZ11_014297 [Volvox africanus]|uniref:Uncharacterized protein n=1 Tax=Volvox africanus TaxID=51714 RepID=A0ABQ5SI41_9CHLO|nr:hypothetical protein VaNZ11_014297 [Volvox africanus]
MHDTMSEVAKALAAQQRRHLFQLREQSMLSQGASHGDEHRTRQGQGLEGRTAGSTNAANRKQGSTDTAPTRGSTEERVWRHMQRIHPTAMFLATCSSRSHGWRWCKPLPWAAVARAPSPPPKPEDSPPRSPGRTDDSLGLGSDLRDLDASFLECTSPFSSIDSDTDMAAVIQTLTRGLPLHDTIQNGDQRLEVQPEPSLHQERPAHQYYSEGLEQNQRRQQEDLGETQSRQEAPRRSPSEGKTHGHDLQLDQQHQNRGPPAAPPTASSRNPQPQQPLQPQQGNQQLEQQVRMQPRMYRVSGHPHPQQSRWYPLGNFMECTEGSPKGASGVVLELSGGPEGIAAAVGRKGAITVTEGPDVDRKGAVGAWIAGSGSNAREARHAQQQSPSRPRPPTAPQHPGMKAKAVAVPNGQFPVATELADAPTVSSDTDVLAHWLPMQRAIRGAYLRLVERNRRAQCKGNVETAWETIWHVWDIGLRDRPHQYIPSLATPDTEASDAKVTQSMRHLAREASRGADARLQQLVRDMPTLCMLLRKQSGGARSEFHVGILLGLIEFLRPQLLEPDSEWTILASMARDEELPDSDLPNRGTNSIEFPMKEVFHAAVLGLFLLDVSPETERDGKRVVIFPAPKVYECAALGVLHMESSWVASGKPAYDRWHWGISPTQLYYILLFDTFVVGRPESLLRQRSDRSQEQPQERFTDDYFAHLLSLLAEPRPSDSLLAQVACSLTFRDWALMRNGAAIAMERLRAVLLDAERRRLRGQQQHACRSSVPQQPPQEPDSCAEQTSSQHAVLHLAESTVLVGAMQSTRTTALHTPQQTIQWLDQEPAQSLGQPPRLQRTMPQPGEQQPLEEPGVCEDEALQPVISPPSPPSPPSPSQKSPPLQRDSVHTEGLSMKLQQPPPLQQLQNPVSVQQPHQLHPVPGQSERQHSDHQPPLQQLQGHSVSEPQRGSQLQPQTITQLSVRLSEPAVSSDRLGRQPPTQPQTRLEVQLDPKLQSQPHPPPCAQTPSKLEVQSALPPGLRPRSVPRSSAHLPQVQMPPQRPESPRQREQPVLPPTGPAPQPDVLLPPTGPAPQPDVLLPPQPDLEPQHQLGAQPRPQSRAEPMQQSTSPLRRQQQPRPWLQPQSQSEQHPPSSEMYLQQQLTPLPTQPKPLSSAEPRPERREAHMQLGPSPQQRALQELQPDPAMQQLPVSLPWPQMVPPPQLDPQLQQRTDNAQYWEGDSSQPVLQLHQRTHEQPQPQPDVETQPQSHPTQQSREEQVNNKQQQQPPQGLTCSGVTTDLEVNAISFARELYADLLQPRILGLDNNPGRERLSSITHVLRLAANHGLLDHEHGSDAQARALQVLRDIASRDVRPKGGLAWVEAQQVLSAHWPWETDFVSSPGLPEAYTRSRGLLRAFLQGGLQESRWGELAEELRPGLLRKFAGSWGRVLPQQSTMFGWLRGKGSAVSSAAAAGPAAAARTELPPDLRRKLGFLALLGLVVLRGVDVPLEFVSFACCLAAGILKRELEMKTAIEVENADISAGNLFRCLAFIPPLPYLPRKDAWARAVLPPAPPPSPEGLPLYHPLRQQRMVGELEYGTRLYLADQELSSVLSENLMPPCMGLPQQPHRELLLALLLERWTHRVKVADGSPCSSEDYSDDGGVAEWRADRWLLPGLLRYGCTSRPKVGL